VLVLKSVTVESIQNRAARALANLAQDKQNSEILHKAGTVSHLKALLESGRDDECLQSAVRAVRNLADSPSHRAAMVSQGVVEPLAQLLKRGDRSGVVGASARALAELSRQCSTECAEVLSRVDAPSTLVALVCGGDAAVRADAMQTLSSLCSQAIVRPTLGSAGAIRCFVDEIRSARTPAGSAVLNVVRALCLCCREAVNRAKVVESGGIELLFSLLKDSHFKASHDRIILAFLSFFYEESALDVLLGYGLVPILVRRLEEWTLVSDKFQATAVVADIEDERYAASYDFPTEFNRKPDMEPNAESSSFLSMRSWLLTQGYIVSPGDISPRWCPDGSTGDTELEDLEAVPRCSSLVTRLLHPSPLQAPQVLPERPIGSHVRQTQLLSRFSMYVDPSFLVTTAVLRGLLNYVLGAARPSPRAARILLRLAANPNCLEAFVRTHGISTLHLRLCHGLCPDDFPARVFARVSVCVSAAWGMLRSLRIQAESGFGTGTLNHLLLSTRQGDKAACALALLYLCRNEPLRRRLLVDQCGLQLLVSHMLRSPDPSYVVRATGALLEFCSLEGKSGTPSSSPPPHHPPPGKFTSASSCGYARCVADDAAADVKFVLDCGAKVSAQRKQLVSRSEVFGAMLQGHYSEAQQSCVAVRNASDAAFTLLMHHLHGC
uniref:Armadillo repeat containing 5 n=1 Tax=Petromyzon marinus TaxID=7757 RepID=S4RCS4_PETMA